MDDLVKRLSTGTHNIVAARSKSVAELKDAIDRGFVLLKFTETRGGTELGVTLDKTRSVLRDADFNVGKGVIQLIGHLTLNYDKVEIVADIDLHTLKGQGHLIVIAEEAQLREQASQTKGTQADAVH